jgi:hypothetical protein
MSADPRIVIIGAGPTGIGAAWRLQELGHANWLIVEGGDHAGGLASSVVDASGFTWDLGGHVLFSHYPYFDRAMDTALGDAWVEHVREAWVWMRDRWIPYPFQNTVWRLPPDDLIPCIAGLIDLQSSQPATPRSFREWLLASFGAGICDVFMLPYNRKVWAYDPSRLDVGWMGERVATVDVKRVLANLVLRRDDVSWGPNATFRFPLHGGTGAIWRTLSARLPAGQIHFGRTVSAVDLDRKQIHMKDGESIRYDHLISSMALDDLLRCLVGRPQLTRAASQFVYSSSHNEVLDLFSGRSRAVLPRHRVQQLFAEQRADVEPALVVDGRSQRIARQTGERVDGRGRGRGRIPLVRLHRSGSGGEHVASPARARLSHAVAWPRCGADSSRGPARRRRRVQPRPLRRVEVRSVKPGSFVHAGGRGRRSHPER